MGAENHVLLVVVGLGSPDVEIVPLDDRSARAAGQLCGVRGVSDVIDASVALVAEQHSDVVVTSDPSDLSALNPRLRIHAI